MGRVYRATDRTTGAAVALKVMTAAGRDARFAREVEILERLRHPAVVRHIAHGLTSDGGLFLAMEWLDGEDLSARLARGAMGVAETLALARRTLDGLAAAHETGVVHRDLKPGNIHLGGASVEHAKLLDFGVARLADATVTRTGAVLGTPGYMAPEQVRGDRSVDARADVFALGCVLYECLAGRPAFRGESAAAVLAKVLFDDAPRLAAVREDVPPGLDAIIARAMARSPDARPTDAAAFARALASIDPDREVTDPSARPRALTAHEQRRLYVVVAAAPNQSDVATADIETPPDASEQRQRLRARVARFGAELEVLADGSVVATLRGVGSATVQAAAAARCALALRAALPGTPLAVATGSGVLDGPTPTGEVIDHAVKLLREEPPGVRTDAATAALLDARFDVGADARGFTLWREREAALGGRTLLGRPSPCVGRERELASLEALVNGSADEELARAALVVAPAGVGKSRLLRELLARVERGGRAVATWIARGDPMSAGSPFGMLAQLVRHATGVVDGEPAARVTEFLAELAGVPVATPSAELRAARSDALRMGEQMRRAFVDLVAAECASRAVLIALEDLHWGDAATVKTLDLTLRELHERPLVVLALARPEVRETFPTLWSSGRLTEIALGELSRKASVELVRAALGDALAPDILAAVVGRAAGHAFYLEELIRAVAEGRGAELPDTVLAMVDARLDALDPGDRRVLRAASVFGEVFWTGGVAELVGADVAPARLDATLAGLVEREVIERRRGARFAGQDEYAFRHGLVREAAYRRLTDADLILGHRLAGAWLERAGETDASALAGHFDRGKAPERAVRWYVREGQDALAGASFERAIAVAGCGLACGAVGLDRGLLRLIECEAHVMRFELADCERTGAEALALLARGSGHWFGALGAVSMASTSLGHSERAVSVLQDLLGAEPDPGATRSCLMGYCWAAMTLSYSGLYPAVEGLHERAVDLCARASPDDRAAAAFLAQLRYWAAATEDDPWRRLQRAREAVALRDEVGYSGFAARAYTDLGVSLHGVGAYDAAERAFEHAMELAVRTGTAYATTFIKVYRAAPRFERGRVAEAESQLLDAESACAQSGERYYLGRARVQLARIRTQRGDHAGAEAALRQAMEHPQSRPLRAYASALLARVLLAQGRAEEALAAAKDARRIFAALDAVHEGDACIQLAWAEALAATGAHEASREALDAARERVLLRAAKIDDAALRRSFLEDVPDHARTLARARR
jgi:tetratricopeptide (TPR) repeat protein